MSYPSSKFAGWNELKSFISGNVDDGTTILLTCRKLGQEGITSKYEISGTITPHQPGVFLIAHVEKKEEVNE